MKTLKFVAICAFASFVLVSCGDKTSTAETADTTATEVKVEAPADTTAVADTTAPAPTEEVKTEKK
jgi:hypothetical protein